MTELRSQGWPMMADAHEGKTMMTLQQWKEYFDDNHLEAARYAVGWSGSGAGYGEQAREEWPACPGYDWDEGVPEWSEIDEEDGYEYRTVIGDYGPFASPDIDGWEKVQSFGVNPEPEVFDEDGNALGVVYIGEYVRETVYRRLCDDD